MPYKFNIYNREVLATEADYSTVTVLLSGDIKDVNFNNYIYTTVSQNVSSNRKYGFDTTLGSLTATLPSNPQLGDEIEFFDISGKWLLNPLTINNNTKIIEQLNDKLLCNVKFGIFKLIYVGLITGWRIVPLPKHDVLSFVAPVVSISSTLDIGYEPIAIGFIGINNLLPTIGPIDNWYWNLTGGSQPDYFTQAVTYTYSIPGVYTVTLTGSNLVGIGTVTKTITALPFLVPTPVISAASLSGVIPFTITLSGINTLPVSASPVTNWYWNLTGGNTAQFTTQNVTYTYTTSGSYTVNLTASNSSGFGTTTQTITL
jgi:PKD repeat protein